jgi:L-lysine exporter family protein LysE/ArgO
MISPFFETSQPLWPSLASGFGLTAGLIVAIGAQNAFVLKQGVQGKHIGAVVLLCCVYDIILEVCGLAGMGRVILAHPTMLDAVRYLGAAMLVLYGLRSWRAAWRGTSALTIQATPEPLPKPLFQSTPLSVWPTPASVGGLQARGTGVAMTCSGTAGRSGKVALGGSLSTALWTVTLLTWLNPHVYLDTVVLLGGVGGRLPWPARGWFGVGEMAASCLWFVLLGYGARRMRAVFARPAAWRLLDAIIGCLMFAIAASLLFARFPP